MPVHTISDIIDIVDLGASKLDSDTNVLLVQAKGNGFDEDQESVDDAFMFGQLGITARHYPVDENGMAQGLMIRGPDVIIGVRDTRTAQVVGNLQPGDTAIHSTGPKQAARIFLKEEKKQVVMLTKDNDDYDMALVMDGDKEKFAVTAFGCLFEISKQNGIMMSTPGGCLWIQMDGKVSLNGSTVFLGNATTGPALGGTPGSPIPSTNVVL